VTRRISRDEAGQGLVEYALIIALVSLASVVALGFLSGKIDDIFFKSGNALSAVDVAAAGAGAGNGTGGSATGGGGSTPPTSGGQVSSNPGVVTSGVPNNAIWSNAVSSSLFDPGAAALSNTAPSSPTCSISFDNGNTFTFSGIWVPDPPGVPEPIWNPSDSSTNYHWACIGTSWVQTPSNGQSYGTSPGFDNAGKSFGDNLIDGGTYFTSRYGHSGAPAGGAGIYATAGNGGTSGTRAFYYTASGVYICTWGSDLPSGQHWSANQNHVTSGDGTQYTQLCATSA
jgi:pilus assembly protein Flp/PilA